MAPVHHKEFRFPVAVTWEGGRRTTAHVEGKSPVAIATPPVFRGTDPDMWSPEDALVAATASCLAVTLAGLADREQLPMHDLSVQATGIVGRRSDGRFGFVRIEQSVEIGIDPDHEGAARTLVERAEDGCLVSASLSLPVVTTIVVRSSTAAP